MDLIEVRTRRLLDVVPARPGERPFVSAASGLVEVDGQLFVIADDEHTLAVFPSQSLAPGTRHLLLQPEAADLAGMPKALKPDLEALCALPDGRLLAVPSGSAPLRHLGAMISLERGVPQARGLDFGPLFARLRDEVGPLNLEGAAVVGPRLWLAQRGNNCSSSALIEIDLQTLGFRRLVPLHLGELDGVPFTPTDLCPLPDGRLLVSAVCEDTCDSYRDGACVAAAVAVVAPGKPVERIARLTPTFKVEGLIARAGAVLWMVCDADDPARPSPLLEAALVIQ